MSQLSYHSKNRFLQVGNYRGRKAPLEPRCHMTDTRCCLTNPEPISVMLKTLECCCETCLFPKYHQNPISKCEKYRINQIRLLFNGYGKSQKHSSCCHDGESELHVQCLFKFAPVSKMIGDIMCRRRIWQMHLNEDGQLCLHIAQQTDRL